MRKIAIVGDLVAVLLFVGIGRAVHAHGLTVPGMASTSWPFLSGLAIGWLAVTAARREPWCMVGGLVIWISTVAFGMALRVISGQGIALAFVFVALGFVGAVMLGWRIVAVGLQRWRVPSRAS